MSVTITLNDELTGRLEAQAEEHHLSVEQWAQMILGHAAGNPYELGMWISLNRKRLDLIRKRYTDGLDEPEERELATLQEAVARVLEPWDQQMFEKLEPYETLARQLARGPLMLESAGRPAESTPRGGSL